MAGAVRNLVARAGIDLSSWEKNLKKMQRSLKKTSKKLQKTGRNLSYSVTAPIVGFATLATKGTQELRMDMAKLETNAKFAGVSIERINKHMENLNAVTGETDSNVEALSNVMAAGFKGTNMDQVIDSLAGAVIKFPDTLKIEGLADGLQETLATGKAIGPFGEMLERLGFNLDDFNVGLMRATKSGTEQQYILDTLAKAGLSDVTQAYIQNNKELVENQKAQFNWKQELMDVGDKILPIFSRLTNALSNVMNAFNQLTPAQQDMIVNVGAVAAAIGPLLIGLGQVVGSLTTIGAVFGTILGPVGLVIAAITGLAAVFVHVYNTNEEFKNSVDELFSGMKENFAIIGEVLQEFWSDHGDEIMNFLNKAAEFIANNLLGKFQMLSGVVEVIAGLLTGDWDTVLSGTKDYIDGWLTPLNNVLSKFTDAELSAENIFNWFADIPDKFLDIKNGVVTLFESLPALLANPIIDAFNGLIDGLNDINIDVPSWVPKYGGKSFGVDVPNIPQLAKGGIVMPRPGGTLANIAEAGKPEAVIPLDKLGNIGGRQPLIINLGNRQLFNGFVDEFGKTLQLQSGFRG